MFSEVIVGVDDRRGGRDGIPLARTLMTRRGGLTLVRVLTADPAFFRGVGPESAEAERAEAFEMLETVRKQAGVDAYLRCGWWQSVGRGLHEVAEELSADLLVVGSSSRGVLGRVLIGDDTQASLNGAPCAVAVAPLGYGEHLGPIREVGVGYDGSPQSETALKVAREIATAHGARISACQAVTVPTTKFGPGQLPLSENVDRLVRETQERLDLLHGVDARAVSGSPAEALTIFSHDVDLLVLGSRSYGPVRRLMHGSTSSRLARTARCPLLVVPRSPVRNGIGHARARETAVPPAAR